MYSVGKMFTYCARSSRFSSQYRINQHSVLKDLQERGVQVQGQERKMLKLERQLQGFKALAAIAEDPGLILSNHMVTHNHL